MKKKIILLTVCCLIQSWMWSTVPSHEIHISKCQIEYNEVKQSIRINVHIYIDDFEEALVEAGATELFLCTEQENSMANEYITNYLKEKISIQLNDQVISFQYVGRETSEDKLAIWCYFKVEQVTSFSKCTVTNTVLIEKYEDQKNIISIAGPKAKKAYFMFDHNQITESVTF